MQLMSCSASASWQSMANYYEAPDIAPWAQSLVKIIRGSLYGLENLRLDVYSESSIPRDVFQQCFNLIESNLKHLYRQSALGWSSVDKQEEMREQGLIYVTLSQHEHHATRVLGFVSFMHTEENGEDVVYCYEIQLASRIQGLGVGKSLMQVVESYAAHCAAPKCMLTVFSANRAVEFYRKIGYTLAENSPQDRKLRNGVSKPSYYILEKAVQHAGV
ncbi:uncharacterized protein V1510DRAFT_420142 [Dipodascopsis tothii]|uniref:uncharacterized protein n=1 Tax=Dipodascopsis tothii TaxID=44089 RepID=UPI0034CEC20D